MNKALAISLLVICNIAAVCILSVVNLAMFFLTISLALTILIGLAAAAALGFGSSRLLSVFERKYRLKTKWFILASYVSPIIGTAVYWIVYLSLDAAGYFSGWFAGLGEFVYAISLSATAAVYFISGVLWCLGEKP